MTKTLIDRILENIMADTNSGCWLWTRPVSAAGYACLSASNKQQYVHRLSYESFVGKIPDGLDIDHKCRTRSCVNPAHLEPVTRGENVRRGLVPKIAGLRGKAMTHCKHGHEFTPENTYINIGTGDRVCRMCRRLLMRERRKVANA